MPPPEKACELCDRFEIHHTPIHCSWINMAEIGIGMLGASRLNLRTISPEEFRQEVKACIKAKNAVSKLINWQLTNEQARIKRKALYPFILQSKLYVILPPSLHGYGFTGVRSFLKCNARKDPARIGRILDTSKDRSNKPRIEKIQRRTPENAHISLVLGYRTMERRCGPAD
jgi:hypothetical protein